MPRQIEIWLDGVQTRALPIPDRGLDFGDGVFETLLVLHGKPLFVEAHLTRLSLGLQRLAISDCVQTVRDHLDVALAKSVHEKAVVRISVLRGSGPRGYTPAASSKPRILLTVTRLEFDPTELSTPAHLGIAEIRLAAQPFLARIKHLNRLEQVIAASQAKSLGVDECLLLDSAGQIVSVIAGNIFLLCDGELLTPAIESCGVAGTRRHLIMQKWARSIDLTVREAKLTLQDLARASEVFYSNALFTVRPVKKINRNSWDNHSVCTVLFEQFLNEISCCKN